MSRMAPALFTSDGHRVLVDAGRFLGGDHLVRRRLNPIFLKSFPWDEGE